MKSVTCLAVLVYMTLAYSFASAPAARAVTLDFEGLADLTAVTNQYAGVTFTRATAITAGMSLNEIEFPPKSGQNVVFDNGGPITGVFSTPVSQFGAYFTHTHRITITAWDTSNSLLGSLTSAYANNAAATGEPGSTPNEFLSISFSGGIGRCEILGDSAGGSFVMDDVTFAPLQVAPAPDPSSLLLAGVGLLTVGGTRYRMRRKRH